MIIKVDIDGVLRNILSPMCKLYNEQFKTKIKEENVNEYAVDKFFTKIKKELGYSAVKFFFEDNSKEIFRNAPIYEGAKEALDILKSLGHKIVIVSWQRTLENKINTLEWLNEHNIQYDDICFTNNKHSIIGGIMIDDNPEFLCQCADLSETIMIDRPYNKNADNRHKRYSSVIEYVIKEFAQIKKNVA